MINLISEKIYKYRYGIALLILLVCVMFEISGSSLGCWNIFLNNSEINDKVFLGDSREIRTDDWAVSTSMALSQFSNDFGYTSSIVRGTDTDMFIVYGQPVKDISMIFKIFQAGYLIFGASKGLSFFWCARIIALFMATFEFTMLITNKNKKLSLIGAMLITFSSTIQWWFATNGLVEMIVYAELAVILFDKYFNESKYRYKALYLSIIAICAGGYILTLYPAWMIPIAYMFLPFLIWVVIKNWKNIKFTKKDIAIMTIVLLVFVILMGRIYIKSADTVKTVMNTVYPGQRALNAASPKYKFFDGIINLFTVQNSGLIPNGDVTENTCEASTIIDFWPILISLLFIVIIKEKKKDKLLYLTLRFFSIFIYFLYVWISNVVGKIDIFAFVSFE